MHGAGQWLTPGPAEMPSAPQGQLLSHAHGCLDSQSGSCWLSQPPPVLLCWQTLSWLAHSLLLVTHHGHQCASASKVSEGGKINSPAGWQGLRNLPPWALWVCSTGDQLQISPLHKDATEWLSGLEGDPLALRSISKPPHGVPRKEYQPGKQLLWGLPQHYLSVHAQRERWAALTLTWKRPGRTSYCPMPTSTHTDFS